MAARPLVLIHGYSDTAEGFAEWRKIVMAWGRPITSIYVGNYVSLSNEVTIKDIAEGFDRALAREADLGPETEFDAVVHSTGMLVIRSWLNSYAEGARRRACLKHLIALAPATNGSPLAHKGRSWLGSIFKGNRQLGPDFLEAGDKVLQGLELGSRFTWDLAHQDLLHDTARFRAGPKTPFVFTFCGNANYGVLHGLLTDDDGSDGTVRWAGCALNSRKVVLDLMVPADDGTRPKIEVTEWANQQHPLVFINAIHHGTILSSPPKLLQDLVSKALKVETAEEFSAWNREALRRTRSAREKVARWQQFVVRVMDERGDPVTDWNLQLFGRSNSRRALQQFSMHVHVFGRDPSLRCFHVNLDKLGPEKLSQLHLRLIASSGSRLVAYHGVGSERVAKDGTAVPDGKWDASINLAQLIGGSVGFDLFHPFTTTFIEIQLNREPMPMHGRNQVYWFAEPS